MDFINPKTSYNQLLASIPEMFIKSVESHPKFISQHENAIKSMKIAHDHLLHYSMNQYTVNDWDNAIFSGAYLHLAFRYSGLKNKDINKLHQHFKRLCHSFLKIKGNTKKNVNIILDMVQDVKAVLK